MPQEPSRASSAPSRWVNMRGQDSAGWAIATGLCVFLAIGMTVLTIMTAVTEGVGTAATMFAVALPLGLLCWPLLRMAPRYSTRQGILVDDAGITLVQEPRKWFPGRAVSIPWSLVRRTGQDRRLFSGTHTPQYFVYIELRESLDGASYPTWATHEEDRVRIRLGEWRQAMTVRALRALRPDLFDD